MGEGGKGRGTKEGVPSQIFSFLKSVMRNSKERPCGGKEEKKGEGKEVRKKGGTDTLHIA